jgi:hypothetical protein
MYRKPAGILISLVYTRSAFVELSNILGDIALVDWRMMYVLNDPTIPEKWNKCVWFFIALEMEQKKNNVLSQIKFFYVMCINSECFEA